MCIINVLNSWYHLNTCNDIVKSMQKQLGAPFSYCFYVQDSPLAIFVLYGTIRGTAFLFLTVLRQNRFCIFIIDKIWFITWPGISVYKIVIFLFSNFHNINILYFILFVLLTLCFLFDARRYALDVILISTLAILLIFLLF